MIVKPVQAVLRKPPQRVEAGNDVDPAKLSATLRNVALRAHRLVRETTVSDTGGDDTEQELAEVHAQIIRLQRNLNSHQLDGLATYVSALRERVEECMA